MIEGEDLHLPIGRPVLWLDAVPWPLPLPEHRPDAVVNVSVASAHPDGRVAGCLSLANGEREPVLWQDREPVVLPKLIEFPRCEAQMLLDSGIIDDWREQDAETARENRRRAAWQRKLARAEQAGQVASDGDGERVELVGWAEFEREGLLR